MNAERIAELRHMAEMFESGRISLPIFIKLVRTAMPELLDEVERLTDINESTLLTCEQWREKWEKSNGEVERLQAENKALGRLMKMDCPVCKGHLTTVPTCRICGTTTHNTAFERVTG